LSSAEFLASQASAIAAAPVLHHLISSVQFPNLWHLYVQAVTNHDIACRNRNVFSGLRNSPGNKGGSWTNWDGEFH